MSGPEAMYWTGPVLRDHLRYGRPPTPENSGSAHFRYEYVDAAGTRDAEWSATHILIKAFYDATPTPLDEMEAYLGSKRGFVSAERVGIDPDNRQCLRPQVVALFSRSWRPPAVVG